MVQRSPALRAIVWTLKCSQIHSSSSLKHNAGRYLHTGTAHHCPSSHLLPRKAAQYLVAAQQGNTLTQLLQAVSTIFACTPPLPSLLLCAGCPGAHPQMDLRLRRTWPAGNAACCVAAAPEAQYTRMALASNSQAVARRAPFWLQPADAVLCRGARGGVPGRQAAGALVPEPSSKACMRV